MRACSAALPTELSALLCTKGARPLYAGAQYLKRFQKMSAAHRRREQQSEATPRPRQRARPNLSPR